MTSLSAQAVVLGAGLAGLAAADRLQSAGVGVQVLEKAERPGGLAKSRRVAGFTFDHGPHVSFTKRPDIRELLAHAVQGRYREAEATLLNLYQGRWLPHPAQSHLHGLPAELVASCIADLAAAAGPGAPVENYAEWCLARLGRTFSEEFTFRYTRKYWTVEPEVLTADWVGTRMHVPSVREVALGALTRTKADQHYITRFRYPTDGGFEPYLQAVLKSQPVATGQEVVSIDAARRMVELSSGGSVSYELLVSSLPLPMVVDRLVEAPTFVKEASSHLRCSALTLVNVGLDRDQGFPDSDWMYFYDEDIVFARACLPHRLAAANAPPGCGSVQVEIYGSAYRPLPAGDLVQAALEGMRRAGLVQEGDRLLVLEQVSVPYANVIFDARRSSAVDVVRTYLAGAGIETCGRFGEWGYLWTDDSIHSGWDAAGRALTRLGRA